MTAPVPLVLAALTAAVGAVVATTAVRHPIARRLGIRSAMRRPAETALVTLGALLGTAIITGSLVVGDSLERSLRSDAFTQLGPVDETVTAPGLSALPGLRAALSGVGEHPEIDGVAFGLRSGGTAAARIGGDDTAVQPDALLLEISFDQARELGDHQAATGLDGASTPSNGGVAISSDLARQLAVDAGEDVTVFAFGQRRSFHIQTVLPQIGLAGYSTGLDARSFNIFLPPGTLDDLTDTAEAQQAPPPIALAFVSNEGNVLGGVEHTERVTELVEERIAELPNAQVTASKRELLDTAEAIGSALTEIFLAIGAFAVIAGVLLLVNVFVMLAQERRAQLGIMRAVGMPRQELIRSFFLEGSFYAGVAALLGAAAGIGVGAGIIELAKGLSVGAGATLDLRFSFDAASIAGGAALGLLIALTTALATSVRISRLNIIRAIRELPEPSRRTPALLRMALGAIGTLLGAAITAAAVAVDAGAALLIGPAILAASLVALLSPFLGRRLAVTVPGLLLALWGIVAPTLRTDAFRDADVVVFVLQGLVITGAAVVVLARNQDAVGRLVRRLSGGTASPAARLGLAYPLARPFRTTMTMAMYALIVFTLVLVSLVSQVVSGQPHVFADAESGDYDVLVTSSPTNPLPVDAARGLEEVELVAPLRHAELNIEFRAPGHAEFRRWFASGYDRRFLAADPPALDRWFPELPTQRSVWQHVLDDPSAMIVGSQFLQQGGSAQTVDVGAVVDVRDPVTGERSERTIAGIMQGGLAFSGALMSDDSLRSLLGPRAPVTRLYVAVAPQADPADVAAQLEQQHIPHGVEARTFRAIVEDRQQQNRQFMRILQGYLVLGLLVGTAGLGVIMVRAVRERRQEIGVLRSIGLQRPTVERSFMLEAGFIALQGIIIGTLLGGATAYQLIGNAAAFGGLDVRFVVPWPEIMLLIVLTLAAAVAAAGWPARRAGRIRPAEALRSTG